MQGVVAGLGLVEGQGVRAGERGHRETSRLVERAGEGQGCRAAGDHPVVGVLDRIVVCSTAWLPESSDRIAETWPLTPAGWGCPEASIPAGGPSTQLANDTG